MPLHDDTNQQLGQGLSLVRVEHGEQLFVRGHRVGVDRHDGATTLFGEVGALDAAMFGIGLTFDEAVPFQRGQRQLGTLRADQQPARQVRPGQSGLVGELTKHADLSAGHTVLADGLVDGVPRVMKGLLEQPKEVLVIRRAHEGSLR